MGLLERLFLGKDAIRKLDDAKKRVEEAEELERADEAEERMQRAAIRELAKRVKEDAQQLRTQPPPVRLRHVSFPELNLEDAK